MLGAGFVSSGVVGYMAIRFLMSCFSSESRKTLTRAALLWYFGAIMYSAVSEFRRFTREGRARSGCVAALLLS